MEFIQRFGAGTRAAQTTARRKVERLQTNDLARSNIQRPYIRFTAGAAIGPPGHGAAASRKVFGDNKVVTNFEAVVNRGEKIVLMGRNGVGKTTLLRALLPNAPEPSASADDRDAGTLRWGHEVSIGYFAAGSHRRHPEGHDRRRVAAPVRSGRPPSGHSRSPRADAVHRRRA